jgi:rubredoxin
MKNRIKKILATFVIIPILLVFGSITGFVLPGSHQESGVTSYNDIGEGTEETENEPEESEEEDTEDIELWVCQTCGYTYDAVIAGTPFPELPESWVCPVCGALKSSFLLENEEQFKDPQEWLAHLEHVLAMRSKHLAVLQRVIVQKVLKNNSSVNSILSLQHAIQSSSKSVFKAQEAVDEYKAYIETLSTGTTEETGETITTDTTTIESSGIQNNENEKNIGQNKNNNGNNGGGKENKENNGKGNGKNK